MNLSRPLKILTRDEAHFVKRALMYFDIQRIAFKWDNSCKRYPDLWVTLDSTPIITVTQEWKNQTSKERMKRVIHELIHVVGINHNSKIGYNSHPDKDTYSMKIYRRLTHA
jgi:predicted metallopeptidase